LWQQWGPLSGPAPTCRDITDILIDVDRAARAALKEAHPKLAVGWGVSAQDFQAEAGAEHVLKDSRHPRDRGRGGGQ
jgi:beta-glucosidase